jgi:hypothetical protein
MDSNLLSLNWHNKMVLPADLPRYPLSLFDNPATGREVCTTTPGLFLRWSFANFS